MNQINKTQQYFHTVHNEHSPSVAAIDLGTNSCRLLVARVNIAGLQPNYFRSKPKQKIWKVVDSLAKIVRLGEGLHEEQFLTHDAIERALEALSLCRQKLDYHHVKIVRAVATEACRRATNTPLLIERAKNELNLDVEVISASEEARLAINGCIAVINPNIPYALIFDIGGGSTEVAWISVGKEKSRRSFNQVNFNVIASISLPYGVVTLSQRYKNDLYTVDTFHHISKMITEELNMFFVCNGIDAFIQDNQVQLIGTSGTVTTLAAMVLNLKRYEKTAIDGSLFDVLDLEQASYDIFKMNTAERNAHPCIGNDRTDLVITGSAILKGIYDRCQISQLKVADRGVREGIILDLVKKVMKG